MSESLENTGTEHGGPGSPSRGAPASIPSDLLSRLRRMFVSPGDAFQPPLSAWVWVAPMILLSLCACALFYASSNLLIAEGMVSGPGGAGGLDQLPADKLAMVRVFMGVGALTMTWVGYLIPAVFFWMGLNFVLGGRAGFGAVLAVTVFTGLVMLPRDILLTFLRVRAGSFHIYTSPAVFADPEQKGLIALLEHLDIFALYRLVLLWFGFRSISGLRAKQTGWLVGILWVLGAALTAGMASLGQRFGR
jgi:hypothetical protein